MSIYDISYKHNIYNDRYIIENTIFIITILPLPEQKKKIYIEMVLKYYYEYTSNINYNPSINKHLETNIKAINYLEVLPLLVHKIQTMQKEIDELKALIKTSKQ